MGASPRTAEGTTCVARRVPATESAALLPKRRAAQNAREVDEVDGRGNDPTSRVDSRQATVTSADETSGRGASIVFTASQCITEIFRRRRRRPSIARFEAAFITRRVRKIEAHSKCCFDAKSRIAFLYESDGCNSPGREGG